GCRVRKSVIASGPKGRPLGVGSTSGSCFWTFHQSRNRDAILTPGESRPAPSSLAPIPRSGGGPIVRGRVLRVESPGPRGSLLRPEYAAPFEGSEGSPDRLEVRPRSAPPSPPVPPDGPDGAMGSPHPKPN